MQRVAAQERIVFFDLQLFSLQFLIAAGHVAGGRFAFLARSVHSMVIISRGMNYSFPWRASLPAHPPRLPSRQSHAVHVPSAPGVVAQGPSRPIGACACTVNRVRGSLPGALGMGLPGQFADAVGVLFIRFSASSIFVKRLVGRKQAQREVAVEIVRAGIAMCRL